MADDVIRREDAKALFCKCCESGSKVKCWLCKKAHPMDAIPAADAPVVHARWIVVETEYSWNGAEYPTRVQCSNCEHEMSYLDKENFCPKCGADMREVD